MQGWKDTHSPHQCHSPFVCPWLYHHTLKCHWREKTVEEEQQWAVMSSSEQQWAVVSSSEQQCYTLTDSQTCRGLVFFLHILVRTPSPTSTLPGAINGYTGRDNSWDDDDLNTSLHTTTTRNVWMYMFGNTLDSQYSQCICHHHRAVQDNTHIITPHHHSTTTCNIP